MLSQPYGPAGCASDAAGRGGTVNRTTKAAAVGATTALAIAAGISTALAAIPDSGTGTITGCSAISGGALRVIDAQGGASCTGSERRITWPSKGIRNRGAWTSTPIYYVDDLVTYSGQTYLAKLQNRAVTPTNTTNWTLLAARGATGPTGPRGPAGSGPGTALQANNDFVQNTDEDNPVEIASFALPAGSWLVQMNAVVADESSTNAKEGVCTMATDDGAVFYDGFASAGPLLDSSLSSTHAITVAADTTLRMSCYWVAGSSTTDSAGVEFNRDSLIATPLDGVIDNNLTTAPAAARRAARVEAGSPSSR